MNADRWLALSKPISHDSLLLQSRFRRNHATKLTPFRGGLFGIFTMKCGCGGCGTDVFVVKLSMELNKGVIMPSGQDTKIADKPLPRGGKPPKGIKRVAARPMGASGAAARSARLNGGAK